MKKLFLYFIILLFSFCAKKKQNELPRIIVSESDNVVEVSTNEMLNIYSFIPLAFNFKDDVKIKQLNNRFELIRGKRIPFDSIMPKFNLKIIIDTTYVISSSRFEHEFIDRPINVIQDGLINGKVPTELDQKNSMKEINKYIEKKSKLLDNYVRCYTLLVHNNSNNDVFINSEFIQEAKDIDGKWKPIEFTFEYEMCGTGKDYQSILDPKKYVAFAIIKYNGNFKTKVRVKLRNNKNIYYSNEIDGSINRSQFYQGFCNFFLESYGSNVDMNSLEQYKNEMFLKD